MSGEKRHSRTCGEIGYCNGCTPTPEPSEVAETTAGEREVEVLAKVPRHVWISDSVCIDPSRVVSIKIIRAPLPRYAGQFLGGRRDVVLTLDTGKEHTVTAVDEDNRRRDFESHEPAEQRDRVEAAARAWVDDLLRAASVGRGEGA